VTSTATSDSRKLAICSRNSRTPTLMVALFIGNSYVYIR
jgi:hypothetical protein